MAYRRLRKELRDSGFTQADVAREMGVRPQTVSYWLNGEHAMKLDMAVAIRDTFLPHMTLDELFCDVGSGS